MNKKIDLGAIANRDILSKQILENPCFKQAFIALKAKSIGGIEKTKFKDVATRDEHWRRLQTLNALYSEFESAMKTGKLVDKNAGLNRNF